MRGVKVSLCCYCHKGETFVNKSTVCVALKPTLMRYLKFQQLTVSRSYKYPPLTLIRGGKTMSQLQLS